MRTCFALLDDWLIERVFQPISDVITDRIGFSRTTAACFCVDFASTAWIVSRARGLTGEVTAWDAGAAVRDMSILLLGLIALVSLRMLFRRTERRQANPLRLSMQPHRGVVLMMLTVRLVEMHAPGLVDAADLAMLLFAGSALYLGACVERPPVRRGRATLVSAFGRAWAG
ncbi:MAG TPA: hypothetical protein VHU42_03310 [Rhodopila sp.]|jgi:hypothetical protein|nr:hypothetical protein [Rhodopila sp.]